ncbi:MAG TPA: hypothetical protein VFN35_35225, partial [Ktedonobacteraceae bacterium]|nr:hypothetical protein [Ktedonobacteraceae bacterium]
MPRRAPYLLQWSGARQIYEFSDKGFSVPDAVIPDGDGWKEWLSSISSFAFSSRSGVHYTVRKESIQQHGAYWYGYRSLARRTYKRYLGRTEHLSLARLEEIAARFQEVLPLRVGEASQPEALRLSPRLISRLCPPRLPLALVERPALLSLLDNWRSYKLSLLRAPAGVGKTTLVNSWLERHPSSHIAWVSLEPSDNTPTSFWYSVISACQVWQAEIGRATLVQLRAASSPPFVAPPLETFLTHFLNDLTARVSDGILVLDDYQTILEPRIHEAMARFIEHLPSQLHVLILTRSEPPLPLTRWRAMGWVQEFSSADLRFSRQETATFLQYTTGSTFSAETIIQLEDLLQGWIAGLRLLVLAGQMTESGVERQLTKLDKQIYPDEFQRQLVDYFLSEVLSMQPESLQLFLLQTCSLPHLTADLCDTVTDRQDSAALLDAIERAGLFLEARDEGEPWYCYSSLFAEAMRDEARRRLGE